MYEHAGINYWKTVSIFACIAINICFCAQACKYIDECACAHVYIYACTFMHTQKQFSIAFLMFNDNTEYWYSAILILKCVEER